MVHDRTNGDVCTGVVYSGKHSLQLHNAITNILDVVMKPFLFVVFIIFSVFVIFHEFSHIALKIFHNFLQQSNILISLYPFQFNKLVYHYLYIYFCFSPNSL